MPLPAATATYRRRAAGSSRGVNRPAGAITSTTSPGASSSLTQSEKAPPSRRFTPMRRLRLRALAQIEYVRRSSFPSTTRRSVRCCPAK